MSCLKQSGADFKKDLPAMNAIKKKEITWYKYANINKVIRKPPIMKNMHFEKTVLCTFSWGNWCWKKACGPTLYLLHEEGALLASLYMSLYTYNLCSEIKP